MSRRPHDDCWCHICDKQWDTLDPGVRYIYGDGAWECHDEVACFARRDHPARVEAYALSDAWLAAATADGWRFL